MEPAKPAEPSRPAVPAGSGNPQSSVVRGAPGWPFRPGASGVPGSSARPGRVPGSLPPLYAHPAPPTRRSGGSWAFGIVTVLAILAVGRIWMFYINSPINGGTAPGGSYDAPTPVRSSERAVTPERRFSTPATTPSGGPGRFTVLYEVTGTAREAVVLFHDADAKFLQPDNVAMPWRLKFTTNNRDQVRLVATSIGSGNVTCQITIDGQVVVSHSGRYGVDCFIP
ncbi:MULTISPECIES: MmpS family transport accessory protein [unclassified Micromonospora]|uniref:MmpS family transport accessory protein n=1 Tax=unclassified Micromonospora TaxID=2617518 RepID=UPI0033A72188